LKLLVLNIYSFFKDVAQYLAEAYLGLVFYHVFGCLRLRWWWWVRLYTNLVVLWISSLEVSRGYDSTWCQSL